MASSSSSLFHIEPLNSGETYRHSMDACCLCWKRLAGDHDIFMYRGDAPFCSEECRYHQMVRDEVVVVRKNKPSKTEHPAKKEQQRHRHETPADAKSGRVKLPVNVPVTT